mmetsp:Transcript_14786/g.34923  ORF Transcript_14786/g.34923 Transcript_14786/m.34923 type:complete len:259 (-) Transcript_14786:301-1077(-)
MCLVAQQEAVGVNTRTRAAVIAVRAVEAVEGVVVFVDAVDPAVRADAIRGPPAGVLARRIALFLRDILHYLALHRRERVLARLGQPATALRKLHQRGLGLCNVLLRQRGAVDLEGGAGDVGGAHGDVGAVGREAHCRDAVPNADLLVADRVKDDGGRVDLGHARDVERGDDVLADLAIGDRDADLLHAEELLHIEDGGHVERQVVGGRAGEQDVAEAVVGLGVLGPVLLHGHGDGLHLDHGGRHARGSRDHDQAGRHE